LLIFENIDTVEEQRNIESLGLEQEELKDLMKIACKPSSVAKAGKIDLKETKTKASESDKIDYLNDHDYPSTSPSDIYTRSK